MREHAVFCVGLHGVSPQGALDTGVSEFHVLVLDSRGPVLSNPFLADVPPCALGPPPPMLCPSSR